MGPLSPLPSFALPTPKHKNNMYIDIFLIILLIWAVSSGWRNGLLKELLHTGGVLLGLIIALFVYVLLGRYLAVNGTKVNMVLSIVAFIILCIVIPIALGFVANRFTHLLRKLKLGIFDSLLGAALSALKFLLIISFAFNVMEMLHIMNPTRTASSRLYRPTVGFLSFVKTSVTDAASSVGGTESSSEDNDTTYIYMHGGKKK